MSNFREVLVTGATGFVGTALCQRLRAEGIGVTAFVRSSSRRDELERIGARCVEVDITDAGSVKRSFSPVDCVFHIAGVYRTEMADKTEFTRVNAGATKNLVDAARESGVGRFVHCSTVGVQGVIERPPADEQYRTKPGDHYQESKLAGERIALEALSSGLAGTVVRPVGAYGPGDRRFLKLFKAIARGHFVMVGNGRTLYHLTYIDDLIDGFMLCARHEAALGKVFNIAGAEYTTLQTLVNTIAEVLGRPRPKLRIPAWPVMAAAYACEAICRPLHINPPLYPRRVDFFTLSRAFSIERARRLLGYEPAVSLRAGLVRTAEWYASRGWL